mgnify:CR=1 FL=1
MLAALTGCHFRLWYRVILASPKPRLPVQYPKVNCDGLETVPVATLGDALAAVANLRSHGTVRRRPALRSVPGEA